MADTLQERVAKLIESSTKLISFMVRIETDSKLVFEMNPDPPPADSAFTNGKLRSLPFSCPLPNFAISLPLFCFCRVDWFGYRQVAEKIRSGAITIVVDPSKARIAEYHPDTNTLYTAYDYNSESNDLDSQVSELKIHGQLIHEATHMLCDLQNLLKFGPINAFTSETIAFLAQAIYQKEKAKTLHDDDNTLPFSARKPVIVTFTDDIVTEALDVVNRLKLDRKVGRGALLFESDLLALKLAIGKDPDYQKFLFKSVRFDGINARKALSD